RYEHSAHALSPSSFPTRRSSDLRRRTCYTTARQAMTRSEIPAMSAYKSDFLNILAERGFIHQISEPEALDARAKAGAISAYIGLDRKSTRLNSSHQIISYAVFCL